MCGIAGFVANKREDEGLALLTKMTDVIHHRGPDGYGHWQEAQVFLGHRRLSILDLSEAGRQPMHYADRYVITFNGEIYNYLELRSRLIDDGYRFQSQTDTEVLMALYDQKKEACLAEVDGMFSFAIYDRQTKKLFCARDRFGEKPFFYAYKPGAYFVFGSELKELWAYGIQRTFNRSMLYQYFTHNEVVNASRPEETFYEDCIRLPQAHCLTLDTQSCTITELKPYWKLTYSNTGTSLSEEEVVAQFRSLFLTSVSRRLRSDVPVGSSLSGGLDSSLVVSSIDLLKRDMKDKVQQKTFSARFPGFVKDEGKFMQMVIDRCDVEPHFIFPDEHIIDKLEHINYHQEEPYLSSSILVQYEVMKAARANGVIVLQDGQGADEILGGYRYYLASFFRELHQQSPQAYTEQLNAFKSVYNDGGGNEEAYLHNLLGQKTTKGKIKDNALKVRRQLMDRYFPVLHKDFIAGHTDQPQNPRTFDSLNAHLHYSTTVSGLQQLLRYADRNSMANSVEVRLPFLSHELVEFLFFLPAKYKINNGWTKWIMRRSFSDLLPEQICWRKDKIGYEPPQANWFATPALKEMLMQGLQALSREKILNKNYKIEEGGMIKVNNRNLDPWNVVMASMFMKK